MSKSADEESFGISKVLELPQFVVFVRPISAHGSHGPQLPTPCVRRSAVVVSEGTARSSG